MTRARFAVAAAVAACLLAAAAGVAASQFLVLRVESDSMAPALVRGDVLLAGRLDGAALMRSDIVVFSDPGGWAQRVERQTRADAGTVASTLVKRVIGLPGERVACCDPSGRVTVDGVALDEPYLAAGGLASVLAFDEVVPDDAVFVLGDNRAASVDSRYLGTVPLTSVIGVERAALGLVR
ncbi:signal peptidase I [Microbacterium sp. LMI12-1-1.1]|uniref:signal peptidase I n=1 Tax=Microbacterium sp. LMI12-1-1.1 TaxID=3135225 RepID=UPI0034366602